MRILTLEKWPLAILLLLGACLSPAAESAVNCSVTSTGVAFGNYDPFVSSDNDVIGEITVSCSGNVGDMANYSISLSTGNNGYLTRGMSSGSNGLSYNLFTDATHTAIWGDGSAGTATVSDNYAFQASTTVQRSYTVYGHLPRLQTAVYTGAYVDNLIVTVNF